MVEIGKIKIRKKIYKFEPKQKYQFEHHYKVKERPPIERIKDGLKKFLAPPPKKEEKKEFARPKPGGFNFAVFGAAILIGIIILAMGWIFLSTQVQEQAGLFKPQLAKPSIENTIVGAELLSSGTRNSPKYTAAVMVEYNAENMKNYTIKLTPYDGNVPSEVFILNSERFEATEYSNFVRVLRSKLSKRKILLNEISIKQLETIP
ncbi:MAG: hypothetical protein ACXABY_24770, partial [Candidatus Thorarchaeota archaeon]